MTVPQNFIDKKLWLQWENKHGDIGDTVEEKAKHIVDNPDDYKDRIVEKAQYVLDNIV